MQEVLEHVLDYLKGIWLKRRYIMVTSWLICPLGWIYVAQMDDVYKSEARVYVDTQSLLRPLLRGLTIETNPETQINLMVKTLLSRHNLERISRMTDLDVQATSTEHYEEILSKLKKNIVISQPGSRDRANIYALSVSDKDPELAKNIVQSALTVFIENTLGENRTDSDSAQKFLATQIKEYENRLSESEARLTNFKQKYSDVMPNQQGGYYSQLNSAKEQLKIIELELLEAKTQLVSAKEQLNKKPTNTNDSSKIKGSTIETTYDSRITELESNLDGLLLRYTDQHPDVREIQRRLEVLNEQRSKEIASYVESQKADGNSTISLSDNPVVQEIQIQVNQLENQVASLEVRANNKKNEVDELQNKIHTLPEIEAELVALNRGYNITKQKYEELLSRQETAQLAQVADETTDKIEFKVIDPPRAATKPSGPMRIPLFIVVTIFGLAAGVGLSFLFSQLTPVVTSSSQAFKATGIPVFGSVSATESLGLQAWHRKKTIIFIISNAILLFVLACFMSYFLFPDLIQAPLKRML